MNIIRQSDITQMIVKKGLLQLLWSLHDIFISYHKNVWDLKDMRNADFKPVTDPVTHWYFSWRIGW